ncbi:hypothetical protein [Longirhabdus pacifica]|uniref:hypothetical protein n=1 Tax=Longirhabdus pacifica TaxID=2305227 RepID=UPI0010090752|nr:hypothetical protein [Longirhabdus pacifica]
MSRLQTFHRCQRGETTLTGIFYTLLFVIFLVSLVFFSMYFYLRLDFSNTILQANRAMAIHGGYTSEVEEIITENMNGLVDLDDVKVVATGYPVNRGDTYELQIEYDFKFGKLFFENQDVGWSVVTLPIRTKAVGVSEKVVR